MKLLQLLITILFSLELLSQSSFAQDELSKLVSGHQNSVLKNVTLLRDMSVSNIPLGYSIQTTTAGYYTPDDGGGATYSLGASLCSLNAGAGDGGSQIPSKDGRCWIAQLQGEVDIRVWGAKGDGISDAGPAIRAACEYSGFHQITITVPSTAGASGFVIKSLDPSGLGAIVLNPAGTLTSGQPTAVCSLNGAQQSNAPGLYKNASLIKLGDGLNRPLLYFRKNAAATLLSNLTFDGNKTNQKGWPGGPNGALYVIQMEDDDKPSFETSIRFHSVVVVGGYNGNIYQGSGRGSTWMTDVWSSYSGQSKSDFSLFFNGYDASLNNLQVGSNSGTGIYFAEGSQYQMTDGAIFLNGLDGIRINGAKVPYINIKGVNIQSNGCNGVNILSSKPYAGTEGASHQYTNLTFDGNSTSKSGACSDFLIADSDIENIVSPGFVGNVKQAGSRPRYNIDIEGNSAIWLTAPSLGTGTPYAEAFTNSFRSIKGSYNFQSSWSPSLAGSLVAGSPTYVKRIGSWSRNNNEITIHFNIDVSSLGGATGYLTIRDLPFSGANRPDDVGNCYLTNYGGWTADGGYTTLSGIISPSSATLDLYELGSGKTGKRTPTKNYAPINFLNGVCIYHTDN